jgi:hypothetical protein
LSSINHERNSVRPHKFCDLADWLPGTHLVISRLHGDERDAAG